MQYCMAVDILELQGLALPKNSLLNAQIGSFKPAPYASGSSPVRIAQTSSPTALQKYVAALRAHANSPQGRAQLQDAALAAIPSGAAVGPVRRAFTATKTWIAKELLSNPLADMEAKTVSKKILKHFGGGALSGAGIGTAIAVGQYFAGNEQNPVNIVKRGVIAGVGGAFSKLGFLAGTVEGYIEKALKAGKADLSRVQIPTVPTPDIPEVPTIPADLIDKINSIPSSIRELIDNLPSVNAPSVVEFGAPSYSAPSFSFSAGGGPSIDPSLILALLGGVGLLGYGIGRRKRKKSKRRKKKK